MVSDIKVTPSYQGSDVYVNLSADLSLGNVTLPNMGLPLIIPRTGLEIGQLTMQTSLGGKNQLFVEVNLSALTHLNASIGRLPNGGVLPLIGLNRTIEVHLNNNVTFYISFGDGIAALGIAIPFRTLDALGNSIGSSSLFPVFNIRNVFGAAGIYTSKTAGQNGFGLFADLTNVLPAQDIFALRGRSELNVVNTNAIIPPSRVEKKINDKLYDLHRARKRLQF